MTTYSEGIREQSFQLTLQFCLQSGDDEFTKERDGVEFSTETINTVFSGLKSQACLCSSL